MPRKQDAAVAARADQAQARREQQASTRLRRLGADRLEPRPWRPAPVPPSAVDLAHFALWRATDPSAADPSAEDLSAEDLLDAVTLLPAARAEVEGLESGLLFVARSAGLTWAQLAAAMGFNSPQACQQHYNRLATRQGARS